MTRMGWSEYLKGIRKSGVSREKIAEAAGVDPSQVSRWLRDGTRPSADAVINLARRLERPPTQALISAGYLDTSDIDGATEVPQSIDDLDDEALVDEIGRRLRVTRDEAESAMPGIDAHFSPKGVGVEEPDHRGKKRG